MSMRRAFLVVCAVMAGWPGVLSSQALSSIAPPGRFTDPNRATKIAAAYSEIDSLMLRFAERARVPGIGYAVIVDGQIAHVGVAGLREVSSRSPVDTSTVFRIASMSKSFAAATPATSGSKFSCRWG